MKPETMALIGNLLVGIGKYGLPAMHKIIDQLADKKDPTIEDIEAIDEMMREPESYFEEG